jgi:hypothetical protein
MKTAPQFKVDAVCIDEEFEWFTRDSKEATRIALGLRNFGKNGEFYRLDIEEVIVYRFNKIDQQYVETRRY